MAKRIAILPFDSTTGLFLAGSYILPNWSERNRVTAAINSGCTDEFCPQNDAHALILNSGYQLDINRITHLGTCRSSVNTDDLNVLYAVNVTGMDQSNSECFYDTPFTTFWACAHCVATKASDPLLSIMLARMYFNGIVQVNSGCKCEGFYW